MLNKKSIILILFLFMVFVSSCSEKAQNVNETNDSMDNENGANILEESIQIQADDTQKIYDYVKNYYFDTHLFGKYPDFSIHSIEIVSDDEYDDIVIDGTVSLSVYKHAMV